ncbi:MAG: hypothetical protein WCI36_00105 [bacterium]
MQRYIFKIFFLVMMFLVVFDFAHAANGDMLFQCDFESGLDGAHANQAWIDCGGNSDHGYNAGTTSTIKANQGYNNGKALSFLFPGGSTEGDVYDPFLTNTLNKNEITIVYWEKFSLNADASANWNMKGVRAISTTDEYIGGTVSRWGGERILLGHEDAGGTAIMTTTSAVTWVAGWPDYDSTNETGYCTNLQTLGLLNGDTGGNPITCTLGRYSAVAWSPGYGDTWHKVRMYIKMPTSPIANSRDGVIKLWMDEVLLETITGINGSNGTLIPTVMSNLVGQVSFNPQNGFWGDDINSPTLQHLYDDIKIYEGHVEPLLGGDNVAPSAPDHLTVL